MWDRYFVLSLEEITKQQPGYFMQLNDKTYRVLGSLLGDKFADVKVILDNLAPGQTVLIRHEKYAGDPNCHVNYDTERYDYCDGHWRCFCNMTVEEQFYTKEGA